MKTRKKARLGELLLERKLISQQQLDEALADQVKSGRKLGRILVDNMCISDDQMLQVLSEKLEIPFLDLKQYKVNSSIVQKIPETQARRFRAIVLADYDNSVLVGMADPTDIFAYDELVRILAKPIQLVLVREEELLKTIDAVYRKTAEIFTLAGELSEQLSESDIDFAQLLSSVDVADAPVVKLLQSLFEDAVQINASDIHIEPDERILRIRQRVDGVLQEHIMDEIRIVPALVLRLKLMAGLDIAEKRLPQDGRFSVKIKDQNIDVRLSTMPVQHGESVVMRLLNQTSGVLNLDDLGMPAAMLDRFKTLLHQLYGLILVTGPTGSGKTTTLYSALDLLNTLERKIITVEDPVEYKLPRINQVQVYPKIGLTFAKVLRTALRQDPDVIFIGEMRDEETAEIGLRAAMTGHMVLSTLHTNDAINSISRLLDMGIKNYLLVSALNAIFGQRLVKKNCQSCSYVASLASHQQGWLDTSMHGQKSDSFKSGRGCVHCNHSGYQGRIGVYELLEFDSELTDILSRGDSINFAKEAKKAPGFETLDKVAFEYAKQGIIPIEEVMRISADTDVLLDYEHNQVLAEVSAYA